MALPQLRLDNDTGNSSYSLGLRNVGLGPAIVRNTVVALNGRPVGPGSTGNAIETAIDRAVQNAVAAEVRRHQRGLMHASTSSLGAGDVIPAGSSVTLMRVQGPDVYKNVMALAPHVDVTICYCSVLGRCWTRRLKDPLPEPRDVRSCPLNR